MPISSSISSIPSRLRLIATAIGITTDEVIAAHTGTQQRAAYTCVGGKVQT